MRYLKILLITLAMGLSLPVLADGTPATLYRNPNCGCCEDYARYLKANGFDVKLVSTRNLAQMQKENGVPEKLAGCHIAKIGPYIFGGLVPVDSVKRVLKERPFIKGLTLPGMPSGAPGMPGEKKGPLNVYVISFSNDQPPKLYATH